MIQDANLPLGLEDLLKVAPVDFHGPNPEHQKFVEQAAEAILMLADQNGPEPAEVESTLLENKDETPLALHLAAKLAKSRQFVSKIKAPVKLSVVFAVYKEQHRLLTPDKHPSGEDFLRRKVSQLEWLSSASGNLEWELVAVDDGCPNKSGAKIADLAESEKLSKVRVLHLQDAIDERIPLVGKLTSTDQSRKGGSIRYGMWEASSATTKANDHIILFTDADLSTHLGQAGLLLNPILNSSKDCAIGSRREPTSIVVKKGTRNTRGKLFIYLWKRMLSPALGQIVDTQCGFKAFRAETAQAILGDLIESGFAFDVELLLKLEQMNPDGIVKVPIAWIDSEAESTTTALSPYLTMLQSIAAMKRKYLPEDTEADSFVNFVDSLTEDEWNEIVKRIPKTIADGNPLDFDQFKGVSSDDLQKIISQKGI